MKYEPIYGLKSSNKTDLKRTEEPQADIFVEHDDVQDGAAHPLQQLDALIAAVEQYPDEVFRERVMELVQSVMAMHHVAFHRIIELISDRPDGEETLAQISADELVQAVLMVHGLTPADLETRVTEALDCVRADLQERGADVELVSLKNGVARLRIIGSAQSATTSSAAFKFAIEQALAQSAPDLVGVEYEDRIAEQRPRPLVQITPRLVSTEPAQGNWIPVIRVDEVPNNSIRVISIDDINLLLCNVAGTVYAVRNACPHRQMPLDNALLEGSVLTCSWHGYQYDLRQGGRCLNDPSVKLEPLPMRIEEGIIRVAL